MERRHEKDVKIHCHENVQCINILSPARTLCIESPEIKMRSAFGIERLQQCPLVAYKIKFIYFSLVFFLLAAVSGLAQLHARPSAINECRPKRQWPKGKLPICKKAKSCSGAHLFIKSSRISPTARGH